MTARELAASIFLNNLVHGLFPSLVPFIGLPFVFFVFFNTGRIAGISYVASNSTLPPDYVFLAWVTTPVVLFELAIYALAIAAQLWLIGTAKEKGRVEWEDLKWYGLMGLLLVVLLALQAWWEANLILGGA